MDAWARVVGWACSRRGQPPARTDSTHSHTVPFPWASRAGRWAQPGQGRVLPTETVSPQGPRVSESHSPPSPTSASIASFSLPISFLGSLNSLYFFKRPLCVQPTSRGGPRPGQGPPACPNAMMSCAVPVTCEGVSLCPGLVPSSPTSEGWPASLGSPIPVRTWNRSGEEPGRCAKPTPALS